MLYRVSHKKNYTHLMLKRKLKSLKQNYPLLDSLKISITDFFYLFNFGLVMLILVLFINGLMNNMTAYATTSLINQQTTLTEIIRTNINSILGLITLGIVELYVVKTGLKFLQK